jgi:hypothetical protein
MSKGQKVGLAVAVAVAAFFLLRKAGVVPGPNPLTESVYAKSIPVFPGASFTETGGGNYYDDIGGPVTFTSKTWYFTITDPVNDVAAYYRANLPAGAKPAPADEVSEVEVAFVWIPPGAKEGEEVSVRIESGELRINETVKPKS